MSIGTLRPKHDSTTENAAKRMTLIVLAAITIPGLFLAWQLLSVPASDRLWASKVPQPEYVPVSEVITVTQAVTVTQVVTESVWFDVPVYVTVTQAVTVSEAVPVYYEVPGPVVTVTVPSDVPPPAPSTPATIPGSLGFVCVYVDGVTGVYLDGSGVPGNECFPLVLDSPAKDWRVTVTK